MQNDVKSNYQLNESIAAASAAAGVVNGAAVDHAIGSSVSFFLSVGLVGASATVDMKTQYSADGTTWNDYTANGSNNDLAITQLTAVGSAQLNIPNPVDRYSRVVVTVGTANCTLSVTSVLGPLRHV